MDADQPGLFDLAPPAKTFTAPPRPPRGRNRETWVRTARADVTVVDEHLVRQSAATADEQALTVVLEPGDDPLDDHDPAADDPEEGVGKEDGDRLALDLLAEMVWATAGTDDALESGAFRVLQITSEVHPAAGSVTRGTLSWSLTIKLTDVEALRHLASQSQPGQVGSIADDLAAVWNAAADPFAPVRHLPGITWVGGTVEVRQLLRRGPAGGRSPEGHGP